MSEKITLPVEFEIGTLEEIGLGGLKMNWLSGGPDEDGRTFSLESGTGLGNPWLEASGHLGSQNIYARGDIRELAQKLFAALAERLKVETDGS